ncbi:nodulation S family protein [Kitasatospora sp. NBC_00240]|uniref:class I SAM-dependent DNA methyltransferase n=1 Tax=Kitasatospora sp. NBC_00240 TaxID=2903567 RepID=UPI00225B71A7|nr:SAM-dependent methyltransferase [Kitasatospora sp. NBC_00240]MCX5208196.1 nodulation S family protein [Kitasatospora sp. NBC_00240]
MTAPGIRAADGGGAGSTPGEYFARMYADRPDPWRLADRWYEQRKYALTLAALPAPDYRSAFEPGCSVGVLSALLAGRCRAMLSCDREERALAQARPRLARLPHVRIEHRVLPADWPAPGERFDLVVLSELLYYFTAAEVAALLDLAVRSLDPGGTLLLVHWRHEVTEHASSADVVHRQARAHPALVRIAGHTEPDFLLDVFIRPERAGTPARRLSVAAREGLT